MLDKVENLSHLGSKETVYTEKVSPQLLETFPNAFPNTVYEITFVCPEWHSKCPKTGQPDFGTIQITYSPAAKCLESKSLKLYLFSFSNEGMFMETICNTIAKDILKVCEPRKIKVKGTFNPRGGITTVVEVELKIPLL